MAKFTIVLTSYNLDKYIGTAIQSVVDQTFQDWQLIIVDDGSTDKSLDIIKEYAEKDKRILPLAHYKNWGCPIAVKNGIAKVRTELFGQLDADDALREDAIEIAIEEHEKNPDVGFMYSGQVLCDINLNPATSVHATNRPLGKGYSFIDTPMGQWRTFKLSFWAKTLGVDTSMTYAEDLDMIYKMEEVGDVKMIDRNLYYVRMRDDSICRAPLTANLGRISRAVAKLKAICRRAGFAGEYQWGVGDDKISQEIMRMINDPVFPIHRTDFDLLAGLVNETVRRGKTGIEVRDGYNPLAIATLIDWTKLFDELEIKLPEPRETADEFIRKNMKPPQII
ncbi:hypothetical protein DRH27_02820 [Candidatus Falkowbacteria bacterium]|nr:MAG: hypothetical protein DRH27_02820 [Candidatus Falkowbacteria bacterium]